MGTLSMYDILKKSLKSLTTGFTRGKAMLEDELGVRWNDNALVFVGLTEVDGQFKSHLEVWKSIVDTERCLRCPFNKNLAKWIT
jgi:hypothetical protein